MAEKKIQPTPPAAEPEAKQDDKTETRKTAIKMRRTSARKDSSFRGI